jgi:charged multivesicular body protein 1
MEKEKKRVKREIQQGNNDIAKLYAQNAIRKQTERMNLLQLAARIDSVAARVQTAVTMRQVTGSMATVVRGMDRAMASMNPEQMSLVMDRFEAQFEDLDATASYYENATSGATAVSVPQDEVDLLMQKVADEAGLELQHEMDANTPQKTELTANEQVEDNLNERLRALRS